MVEVLTLHLLLVCLPVVEVVEVGHDDRDRQGDREHARNRAERTHDLPPHTHRPGGREAISVMWKSRRDPTKTILCLSPACQIISECSFRLGQAVGDKIFWGPSTLPDSLVVFENSNYKY